MKLTEMMFVGAQRVDGYGPGFFRVGGEVYQGACLILPTGVGPWGGYDDLETLLSVSDDMDVLFVGTGADISDVPLAMRSALEDAGLGVEVMASPTACRTYNVLLSEGRRIGLAVLPV